MTNVEIWQESKNGRLSIRRIDGRLFLGITKDDAIQTPVTTEIEMDRNELAEFWNHVNHVLQWSEFD